MNGWLFLKHVDRRARDLPASPALRPRKSPSAESHWPAAPSLSQSVRIPRSPAFFPTRPCPLAGPDPIPSSFPSAPAHHPPPAGAPRPSAASKQNPPSSRPARPGCSPLPLRVLCTPPRKYCQSLPLCSPPSVVLAPPATTRRPLFPLAGRSSPPYPSRAPAFPLAAAARASPSTPRRSSPAGFAVTLQTIGVSLAPSVWPLVLIKAGGLHTNILASLKCNLTLRDPRKSHYSARSLSRAAFLCILAFFATSKNFSAHPLSFFSQKMFSCTNTMARSKKAAPTWLSFPPPRKRSHKLSNLPLSTSFQSLAAAPARASPAGRSPVLAA